MLNARTKGNHFITILFFVVLGVLGSLSLSHLSVRFDSKYSRQGLVVHYTWPNASPEALERQVTTPLEGVLGLAEGIRQIRSLSGYNGGSIEINTNDDVNLEQLQLEVLALIRQVYRQLPAGLSFPTVTIMGPYEEIESAPLLTFQFNGLQSSETLGEYLNEKVIPEFSDLKGIEEVNMQGADNSEWVLTYKTDQMHALGITKHTLEQALRKAELNTWSGWISTLDGMRREIGINPNWSVNQLKNLSVTLLNGRVIQLQDLVSVEKRLEQTTRYFRINGRNAIQLSLHTRAGVNTLALARSCKDLAQKIDLPSEIGMAMVYDSTESFRKHLERMIWQAEILALLFLAFLILYFRHWKLVVILTVSLLLTLSMALLYYYLSQTDIRPYSATALGAGIGLAMGQLLVIWRHQWYRIVGNLLGKMLAAFIISIITFQLIGLLPEAVSSDLADFFTFLLVMQAMSIIVGYCFIPAVLDQFTICEETVRLPSQSIIIPLPLQYLRWSANLLKFKKTIMISMLLVLGMPVFLLPDELDGKERWARWYNASLGSDIYQEQIKPWIDPLIGGTLRLFITKVLENVRYSNHEQLVLYIQAGMPSHSSINQMDAALRRMEKELARHSQVERFITHIHSGQSGEIAVYFRNVSVDSTFPLALKNSLISVSTEMSGIDWQIYGVGNGLNLSVTDKPTYTYRVLLKGYNYQDLDKQAIDLQQVLLENPRIMQVDIRQIPGGRLQKDLFGLQVRPDPKYWAWLAITKRQLFQKMREFDVQPQPELFLWIDQKYQSISIIPVNLEHTDGHLLSQTLISFPNQKIGRLAGHSSIDRLEMAPLILKENQQYIRQVSFDYIGEMKYGIAFLDKTLKAYSRQLPLGYSAERLSYSGQSDLIQKPNYADIAWIILGIFVVLSICFESVILPFRGLLLPLLSFTGIFLGFYWTQIPFDQGGYASFLSLINMAFFVLIFLTKPFNAADIIKADTSPATTVETLQFNSVMLYSLSILLGTLPYVLIGRQQPFQLSYATGLIGGIIALRLMVVLLSTALMSKRMDD